MVELHEGGESEVFEVFIRGSIEAVWREVTKTDEVQKAMFNSRMHTQLEVGAPLRMRTPDGKYTGFVGEVLEVDPPHRFAFTFKFTQHDDPPCRIVYELEPVDDGVRFRMTSDHMPAETKSTKAMTSGGNLIALNLKALVETGKLPLKTRLLYAMFWLLTPLTPARLRSENWP